jgi:hypothetical protein
MCNMAALERLKYARKRPRWIDAPSGAGVYIQKNPSELPPFEGAWEPLSAAAAKGQPQIRAKTTAAAQN